MKAKKIKIIKNVDKLGRVVIPKEYREKLHISQQQLLELFIEENGICIKKISKSCALCGKRNKLIFLNNKAVCRDCLLELQKEL